MRSGEYSEIKTLLNKKLGALQARNKKEYLCGQLSERKLVITNEILKKLKEMRI